MGGGGLGIVMKNDGRALQGGTGGLDNQSGAASSAVPAQRDLRGKLSMARLPTMPEILLRLLDLCHREDVSLVDLAALIGRDAGMAARIFSLSSSAAFLDRARPVNLAQCLALLGMKAIKTIVINDSVMQVFNRFTRGRDIDLADFWEHSLRCALIARELARKMGYANPEEAYLGGLLHDIGRLAILVTDPDGYAKIFRDNEDDDKLCAAESRVFALTHAEVGAWLVEKWELDSFLADCVLYHHEPAERVVSAHPLVRIVLLANRLAGCEGRELSPATHELAALCGVPADGLDALLAAVGEELIALAEQLGIELGGTAKPAGAEAPAAASAAKDLQLAARIQDLLLVNQVLADTVWAGSHDTALRNTVQAMKILFDVDAAICFEPVAGDGERYRATPLGNKWARAAQLEFVLGRSDSALARSIDRGPLLVMRGDAGIHLLDDQVLRLLGGEGVLFLPLRASHACLAVLAAAIDSAPRAAKLRGRLACLDHFGGMSAELVAGHARGSAPVAKAEGVGNRLNGVIHEISNPLSVIRNYLTILESENAKNGVEQPQLGIVREEIDRVAKILHSVRERQESRQNAEPGPVHLNQVIEDMVALCRGSAAMAGGIDIRLDLAAGLPEIFSDGDRLKQLFLNLFKNSIEAMPGGGGIRVATAPWGSGSGASHAEICIEDTGPGIPKEVLSSLYQPVASGKGGPHQGLGLAIVGQLVRELRGLINCRSGATGTRFQVLLPFNGK